MEFKDLPTNKFIPSQTIIRIDCNNGTSPLFCVFLNKGEAELTVNHGSTRAIQIPANTIKAITILNEQKIRQALSELGPKVNNVRATLIQICSALNRLWSQPF